MVNLVATTVAARAESAALRVVVDQLRRRGACTRPDPRNPTNDTMSPAAATPRVDEEKLPESRWGATAAPAAAVVAIAMACELIFRPTTLKPLSSLLKNSNVDTIG